jgi:hypothetical protein
MSSSLCPSLSPFFLLVLFSLEDTPEIGHHVLHAVEVQPVSGLGPGRTVQTVDLRVPVQSTVSTSKSWVPFLLSSRQCPVLGPEIVTEGVHHFCPHPELSPTVLDGSIVHVPLLSLEVFMLDLV